MSIRKKAYIDMFCASRYKAVKTDLGFAIFDAEAGSPPVCIFETEDIEELKQKIQQLKDDFYLTDSKE